MPDTPDLLDASLRLLEHWDRPTTGEHPDDDDCVNAFEKATMAARQAYAASPAAGEPHDA